MAFVVTINVAGLTPSLTVFLCDTIDIYLGLSDETNIASPTDVTLSYSFGSKGAAEVFHEKASELAIEFIDTKSITLNPVTEV